VDFFTELRGERVIEKETMKRAYYIFRRGKEEGANPLNSGGGEGVKKISLRKGEERGVPALLCTEKGGRKTKTRKEHCGRLLFFLS